MRKKTSNQLSGMKAILTDFDRKELPKLLTIDWPKALSEARQLCRRVNGCETCQKAATPYIFELKYSYKGRKVNYKYLAFFCSVLCFSKWRVSGKEPFQIKDDGKDVYQKLLGEIGCTYSLQELTKLHDFNFHQAVKATLKDCEKKYLCDYCHENKKADYSFIICQEEKVKRGTCCSKKCLMGKLQKESDKL